MRRLRVEVSGTLRVSVLQCVPYRPPASQSLVLSLDPFPTPFTCLLAPRHLISPQDEIAKLQAESTAGSGSATANNAAAPTPSTSSSSGGAKRLSQPDGCVRILLNKTERGFGFNLSRIDGKHVFRVLEPGGAAQQAGAAPGDEIVAVRTSSCFCNFYTLPTPGAQPSATFASPCLLPLPSLKISHPGR